VSQTQIENSENVRYPSHHNACLLVSNHRNYRIKCAKPQFEEEFCVGVKFSVLLYENQKLQVFKEQSAQKNMSI